MSLSIVARMRVSLRGRHEVDPVVTQDADDIVRCWRADAFDVASDLSWREESGLVHSPEPGHWARVRREIGRRLGEIERPGFPSAP
jgi:hypothetical protein